MWTFTSFIIFAECQLLRVDHYLVSGFYCFPVVGFASTSVADGQLCLTTFSSNDLDVHWWLSEWLIDGNYLVRFPIVDLGSGWTCGTEWVDGCMYVTDWMSRCMCFMDWLNVYMTYWLSWKMLLSEWMGRCELIVLIHVCCWLDRCVTDCVSRQVCVSECVDVVILVWAGGCVLLSG